MTKQVINVGSAANDGTGDTLRAAGNKMNSNFDELYARTPVPAGGATGQILAKASATAGDVAWADAPSGGGSGGTTKNRNISLNQPTSTQFSDHSFYGRGSSSTPLSVIDDAANGLVATDPTTDSTGFKTLLRAIPSGSTSFEIAAKIEITHTNTKDNLIAGVCLVDASANMQIFGLYVNGGNLCWTDDSWTGAWHDNHYTEYAVRQPWVRLAYDSSGNLHFYTSVDGYNWLEIYSGATLSGRGMGTPTRYGFIMHRYTNGTGLMTVPWFYSSEFAAPTTAPLA